jgi:hypothetical protein
VYALPGPCQTLEPDAQNPLSNPLMSAACFLGHNAASTWRIR